MSKNTGSNMLKTCFAKSDWDTPIRDSLPISTKEKPRKEQVATVFSEHE